MQIALVINGLGRGGAEQQLVRLAVGLRNRDHEVKVFTLLKPTDDITLSALDEAGISCETVGLRGATDLIPASISFKRSLSAFAPQVIVAFLFHADLFSRAIAKLAGNPVVVSSVRSLDMGGRHREWLLRLTKGWARAVTTNSAMAVRHLADQGVAEPSRLCVIPNGLDLDAFEVSHEDAQSVRSEFGASPNEFVWLAIGRFDPPKDYPNLLHAFARVAGVRRDTRLWIAGQGPLRERMETLAHELGIDEIVRFLGLRDDIPKLLAGADAVVQASAWEGLPNAVLEGMAAGRPVVATDVGGTRELVESEVSGLLVPPRDPERLSRALVELMSLSAQQRDEMGANGKSCVVKRYTMDRVVDEWEALFQSLA